MQHVVPYSLAVEDAAAGNVTVAVGGAAPVAVPSTFDGGVLHFVVPVRAGELGNLSGTDITVAYDGDGGLRRTVPTTLLPVPVAVTSRHTTVADHLRDPAFYATAQQVFASPYAQRLDQHAPPRGPSTSAASASWRSAMPRPSPRAPRWGRSRRRPRQPQPPPTPPPTPSSPCTPGRPR